MNNGLNRRTADPEPTPATHFDRAYIARVFYPPLSPTIASRTNLIPDDGAAKGRSLPFQHVRREALSGAEPDLHWLAVSEAMIKRFNGSPLTYQCWMPIEGLSEQGEVARLSFRSAASKVVLVVEDDQQLRGLLIVQLRTLGYTPVEAAGTDAALRILRSQAKVDLLLTDVMMPGGIDGRQLAREALVLRPKTKVILTSGYPVTIPDRDVDPCSRQYLLRKPYRKAALAQALEEALASN